MIAPGRSAGPRPHPASLSLAVFVGAGLAVVCLNHPVVTLAAWLLAAAAGGAGIVRLLLKRRGALTLVGISLSLGLVLGAAQTHLLALARARAHAAIPLTRAARFRIALTGDSVLTARGVRLYPGTLLEAGTADGDIVASAAGAVTVFAPDGKRGAWGEILEVVGTIRPAARPDNAPFVINASGRGVTERGFSHPVFAARRDVLESLLGRIGELGAPASSLFEALFLGVKDDLDFDLRDAFSRTGSLHLLALSGLNVGMIAALCLFFLRPIRRKKLKVALAALLVVVYYFIAGPSPSLTRAVIMLALGSLGLLLDRKVEPLPILLVSAALVLLLDPAGVRTLSFQLSYLALAGILTLGKRIDARLVPYLPRIVRQLVAAALAAQVFTAPLVLSSYGVLYPVGVIVSLILIPLTTLFIWSGAASLIVCLIPLGALNDAVGFIMNAQYRLIASVSDFFKAAPGLSLDWRDWFWLPAAVSLALFAMGHPVRRVHELRRAL